MAGLSGIKRNLSGLIGNRIELATLELSVVRTSLLKIVLAGVLSIFTALFAIAYWTALVVYLSWDALGWAILLILATLFSLVTIAALVYIRSLVAQGKLSMPATLAELKRDRDALL